MKMLFLTEKFPPSEGGSRVYYYNLCKNYPSEDVVVLTKKLEGYEEFDKKQQFKIIRRGRPLPNWKYSQLPKMISPLLWSIYLVFKEKIDVVHCGDFLPAGVIGYILKKTVGKPYVFYVHEGDTYFFNRYRFQPKIRKVIMNNADGIVAACTHAEHVARRELGENQEKVSKINPGVDYRKFDPDWRDIEYLRALGLSGRKIILTMARLIERKGQDTVIRAMAKVITEVPDAIYLIAGRGPREAQLRELVTELHMEEYVKFLGFVPNEKLLSLYSICDIFVMVNRETWEDGAEGFGMVFTEANAAGKPVIGGKSGGTEDSIIDGFTGYRVDPYNVEEVAARIITILKDEQLGKRLGKNGREWVVKNCDWRDKAKQLEVVNRSIVG